jgi:hypothetical protein
MKKHTTKLLTILLALAMLLPVTAQAAPTGGWTDEAEQAYQTVTQLVVQRVTESKDYLATATQEENAKNVYALWTSGADVPDGFYDDYLRALANWMDIAAKRGKAGYVPGAVRTVAAMGLDVTDFAGHDLLAAMQRPELVDADEDQVDMLLDLDAAGDAGKTDELNTARETMLAKVLARQQSDGRFSYTKWPKLMRDDHNLDDYPERFACILLTAKSVQALTPYMDRPEVSAAVSNALTYLSEQQLPSGGFAKFGANDVEEDTAVIEMLAALGIALNDECFTKDGNTLLDGMLEMYQGFYFDKAPAPGMGFYRERIVWGYHTRKGEQDTTPEGWAQLGKVLMRDPNAPDEGGRSVAERNYINETALPGIAMLRVMLQAVPAVGGSITAPIGSVGDVGAELDYKQLIAEKSEELTEELSAEKLIEEYSYLLDGGSHYITSSQISTFSSQLLAREKMNIKMTEEEQAKLREIMTVMVGASGEYYAGRTSSTYVAGAVRAMQYLGMDPGDINGWDYLTPLTDTSKAAPTASLDFNSYLYDISSVDPEVWRSRGVDGDALAERFIDRILADQTSDGGFYYNYGYTVATAKDGQKALEPSNARDTISALQVLAPYKDKENVAKAIEDGLAYLSTVQLADGSFTYTDEETPNGALTLSMLSLMDKLDISIDDERFVKNGNTVADAMRTFYVDGVGFISDFEVDAPLDGLDTLGYKITMGVTSTVSALTYLQAAENGKFGPDGKGNSVFEIVSAALTETPLGAILLAVIIVALLAFGMVRRYRRIKKEQ